MKEAPHLIDELWALLAKKECQANRNSKNSSQPPSRDGPGQSSIKSVVPPLRDKIKTSGKPGAQPRHKGQRRNLLPTSHTNVVHQHYCPSHCPCGGSVVRHREVIYRHQIIDVPEVTVTGRCIKRSLSPEYRADSASVRPHV